MDVNTAILERLERVVQSLQDNSVKMGQLLAVHNEKLDKQDRIDAVLFEKVESVHREVNRRSAMGTTGTITGVSMYLKSMNNDIKIVGVQPEDEAKIPGIRRWSKEYVPEIRKNAIIDEIVDINQLDAENMSESLSKKYGLFCGLSAAANIYVARNIAQTQENIKVVTIICDRGDRYISKI